MKRYVLSVLVENHSGVLSRIAGLFSRRGYNIHSLTVGVTGDPKISRMTIVSLGDDYIFEQISKQLNKLIEVIKVIDLTDAPAVYRELCLVKVSADSNNKLLIMEIVNTFRGNIVDMGDKSLTIETTGDEEKISAFIDIMKPYGIKEIVRTGLTAVYRGNKLEQ
ncbi:acetolactate synthase small subunit [Clostridium luticellarii]|uniref:acetolactate synthase small subunit n=1 Tax=Clostridium luticellarii TaxID=1691940 RepID=UPI001A9A6A0E|nr:acetolactate synthase small subunit [Clostridium luticellarii]MCI1945477.1 acetolactate synthase small subunit [Clostridium luticellarii]MCI1968810.1 acetolactate synthase small subunit [Clostridium luticellarii]MCI1995853.1 acetolactate synthase small subunit [Clostridium luticellarii]MCI2040279.1 acetolactate synthase small subunit [Clostridium luticellarii]